MAGLFSRRSKKAQVDLDALPPDDGQRQHTLSFEGDSQFSGVIKMDCDFYIGTAISGSIWGNKIVIGPDGVFDGVLIANSVVIYGQATGEIYSDKVRLTATSSVESDLYHGQLFLEKGAYFEGKSRRYDAPLSLAPDMAELSARRGTLNGA
jgi:cytoskeletal protein CcmA (bactofilin family)